MNTKQQQLLFDKGITNVPSDLLCSDNTLEESVGMIYDNGEHRVIQNPKAIMTTSGTAQTPCYVLYVHHFNDQKRYIYALINEGPSSSEYQLKWGYDNDGTLTLGGALFTTTVSSPDEEPKITSIGKTLVISDKNGLHRYLWQSSSYSHIGDLPAINISFALESPSTTFADAGITVPYSAVRNSGSTDGIYGGYIRKQEEFNDVVTGLYAKNKKAINHKKGFCEPFFIRAALEMYDGSYYLISQPTLLFPAVRDNSFALYGGDEDVDFVCMYTGYALAYCTQTTEYNDWSDIIKDVVLFVTEGVSIYDTLIDQQDVQNETTDLYNAVYRINTLQSLGLNTYHTISKSDITGTELPTRKFLVRRDEHEIIEDIKSSSVYYRLCSIGIHSVNNISLAEKTHSNTLDNLTTQEVLEYDDYFSHCKLYPKFLYTYNSRLNIANVKRDFFEGDDSFIVWDNSDSYIYNIYVTIKTDFGNVTVKHTTPSTKQKMGIYFYYPDSRAINVVIKQGNTTILDAPLSEHPGLNGAYYFAGLPGPSDPTRDTSAHGPDQESQTTYETLSNYIIQSGVNNPWAFLAQGYFKVGTGKIKAMSSITQAISEGQFGSYPLLVFSESGIWSLSVADSGYYNAVHPMSREVCNNEKSITQTDGAVFFSSEKGLMVVVGNEVKCVSDQLSGREASFTGEVAMGNFHEYLKECFIAYDYRDSLLWIFNNSRETNNNYCWVYSIKHGTFGKYQFSNTIYYVVSDYPDSLLQGVSTLYSLTGRVNINDDGSIVNNEFVYTQYSGLMITRPMKFENGLALKSLMDVKNLRQMNGTLQLVIYGSNDCEHWVQLSSLRGAPWKYFRFRFNLSGMKATDRFAGSVILTQERRIDKLR